MMMNKRTGLFFLCAGALVFVSGGISATHAASGSTESKSVDVTSGRITTSFESVPAGEVLRSIADAFGVELSAKGRFDREISVTFNGVSLEKALARVLSAGSYVITYSSGKPSCIEILRDMPEEDLVTDSLPEDEATDVVVDASQDMLIGEALALEFDPQIHSIQPHDDTVSDMFGIEREAQARIEAVLTTLDDEVIKDLVRVNGGAQARRMLRATADDILDPDLRQRGIRILEELDEQDGEEDESPEELSPELSDALDELLAEGSSKHTIH